MKWQVAPEYRDEYLKKQGRKGNNSSSAPTSPAGGVKEGVNPNFRGANGQNLGYDSSYVGTFSAKMDPTSPAYKGYSSQQPAEAFTPERSTTAGRRRGDTMTTAPEPDLDDSPLPPNSRTTQRATYQTSFSTAGAAHSPPTLSSSFIDTPFAAQQMITPAPRRQNVTLNPPSTLVPPSKWMPESSPAAPGSSLFWRSMMGSTPATRLPDISPLKRDPDVDDAVPPSSSPPPVIGETGSPTKKNPPPRRSPLLMRNDGREVDGRNGKKVEEEEVDVTGGFDLARYVALRHELRKLYPAQLLSR